MLWLITILILSLMTLILWYFLFPVRYTRAEESKINLTPPDLYLYSYVFHVHTQFSYDSLGKPEDVISAREESKVDYVIVTDHEVDHISRFADSRILTGVERKLNDEEGNLLGDLIEVGDLKVIVHHFKPRYRWRLERKEDYLFELIDLKDALMKSKGKLLLFTLASLLMYPIVKRRIPEYIPKLLDISYYSDRYLREGWRNKVIGGLDHHVKIYVREVGIRFLFPSYRHSFKIMRNFLLSPRKLKSKEELPRMIKEFNNIISFSDKPSIFWLEGKELKVYMPYNNCLLVVKEGKERREFIGSNHIVNSVSGQLILEGYTYSMRLWRFLFNVKPIFITFVVV